MLGWRPAGAILSQGWEDSLALGVNPTRNGILDKHTGDGVTLSPLPHYE